MRIGRRAVILILLDTVLIVVAIHLALWLRFDGAIDPKYLTTIHHLLPFAIAIYIISFYICRLYNRMWAYASIRELILITVATTAGSLLIGGLVYIIDGQLLPRSIHIINWILVILMLGISRLGWRVVRDFLLRPQARKKYRTLIVGAGDAGAMVVRELMSNDNHINLIPVGFIDDHPSKQSLYLHGLKVLGTREDIPELVRQERIENIIIAMPSVSGKTVREILEICRQTPAKLKILPGVYEIIDDRVRVSKIRDVQLEDLLHREPIRLNLEEIAHYLNQKIVLVTGAGGSIGSELCRQICRFRPHKLILLENCENNLYDIDMELEEKHPGLDLLPCMADIKDMPKINYVFENYRPQVVFHAAAFKHVPMMEHNPDEAVKNNVLGTRTVAEAADRYGVETFILISTDKAVNPTSVMGVTKRVAEIMMQKIAKNSQTRFAAVRFGNVLGSRGSVVPLFKKQIARGGPVTVTHPEMKRYFMTIPEAVQLVIQAGALAKGGEVFVLDMGEPVKIVDLARDLIRLSGLRPDEDIEIKFNGIRPGEKLFEELLTTEEGTDATAHERIFIAYTNSIDLDKVDNILFNRLQRGMVLSKKEVIAMLKEMVPEFQRLEKSQTG